jgi:hypothetical protein
MPGRHIQEAVVVLHETIHELHRKKMDGVLFEVDFEKAYKKVKRYFLQQTLRMKGFDQKWCDLISYFVEGGSVGVKVNDNIDHYFQTKKGLRQGDPLSPLLFNIIVDMLAILIARAKEDDLQKAVNMKLILCIFEQLFGLKINFHKIDMFCFGNAKLSVEQYKNIFGRGDSALPFKYVGNTNST